MVGAPVQRSLTFDLGRSLDVHGAGEVNAQIRDAEQGAVVMDVDRTYIQGAGAY